MKRKFIHQKGLSNKFWDIDYSGTTQKVVYGKIGAKGRETVKEFSNEVECIKSSESLIVQKTKKGYTEIKEGAKIPEKKELSENEKSEIHFWNAIEKSNKHKHTHWNEYDLEEHIESLTEHLSKWGKERLVSFEKIFQEKLVKLYTAEIAELYIILNNEFEFKDGVYTLDSYLSVDGFLYFRCWILLKGKTFFEDITKDINEFISGKYSFDIADCWAEELMYVSDEAYSENHENKDESEIRDAVSELFPKLNYDNGEFSLNREPKSGKELFDQYPELVKSMCELREQ
ncbi:DUF4240 domain-containing protein [Psychroserpens sp. NJDZ02]|uniref:DUF4240 domain-containing protein n=1 Tax=Psychroserpens sp. NJDZ02 TaxID=2570561 RepID=UPI0010A7F411|nr:DUF4240 domain-containing protein [Psychroserpens sp. NJDZ02]QCE42301.1 DUF4240 domain-containing protein [Psychroserpens sp. NJDZ02]